MIHPSEIALQAFRAVTPPEIMKFTLIYDGALPAGGDKRALYASRIRNELAPQLRDLWDNHVVMRQLARTARVRATETQVLKAGSSGPTLSDYNWPVPPVPEGFIDLCAPLEVPSVGAVLPVVRESLGLVCAIDLLFLRHEEPLHLFRSGGDLDNRIKCFFDGLKMPDAASADEGEYPHHDPLCVLLEDDRLISDFSVRTGRLLGAGAKRRFDVRIQATVTVKVLRVTDQNLCLVGD